MSKPDASIVSVVDLHTRADPGVLAIDAVAPRLAWRLRCERPGTTQHAYEVEVASDPSFARPVSSGRIDGPLPFDAAWPDAPLTSRAVRFVRARVWTEAGRSGWSHPLRIEAGLLHADDWIARPVCPPANAGRGDPVPVPLVRRAFYLPQPVASARLYVTALGVHATTINGAPVSADLLEPGWSAYPARHLYAAHDVTGLLRAGDNVIASAIGDGWWRGELTWLGKRGVYGDTTALLAQLEIVLADGTMLTVATDDGWRGATGGWLAADLYGGSTLDLRAEPAGWREPGFDDAGWGPVVTLPLPAGLRARPMDGVRMVEVRPLSGRAASDGRIMVDCGQNLTGWLRLTASGPAGTTITVRHAEVLDDDGRLHTAALRNARATDRYTLDGGGPVVLEPLHSFHGFRFAEIAADAGVAIERIEACVITSDIRPTGSFTCSDPAVNRLWENVRWSQRGNFLALPTDCPQRDERMGWTGDIQLFAATAAMNGDVGAFLASWLADLAADQRADGAVPSVVPNCIPETEFAFGAAGWGDAATQVPWALYQAYGDAQLLRDQFASMRAWVDYCAGRRDADGVWEGDWQFGDWLDPGAPPDRPQEATTPGGYVATAWLSHSAAIVARAAAVIGRGELVDRYRRLSRDAAAAAWARWGDVAATTQTGCAMAIRFAIAPPGERAGLGARLAGLVEAGDGRIGTGFLGTPLVLPALTETGHIEAAYRLLMNRHAPGWLYQVDRGATTMWERWDAIREDGSIHPGDMDTGSAMLSFNHYAYGAVAAWLYRTVAGIAPAAPGYARIRFAPRPGGGLTLAAAALGTPFGRAEIAWRIEGEGLHLDCTVPPGATADLIAPPEWDDGGLRLRALSSGTHRLTLTRTAPARSTTDA